MTVFLDGDEIMSPKLTESTVEEAALQWLEELLRHPPWA